MWLPIKLNNLKKRKKRVLCTRSLAEQPLKLGTIEGSRNPPLGPTWFITTNPCGILFYHHACGTTHWQNMLWPPTCVCYYSEPAAWPCMLDDENGHHSFGSSTEFILDLPTPWLPFTSFPFHLPNSFCNGMRGVELWIPIGELRSLPHWVIIKDSCRGNAGPCKQGISFSPHSRSLGTWGGLVNERFFFPMIHFLPCSSWKISVRKHP